jgi:protease IV
MTSRLAAAALLLAVISPLAQRRATAQTIEGDSEGAPTRGVYLPGAAIAGGADATAVESNPGQLGLVETTSTALVASAWKEQIAHEGRGLGLLFASPLIVSNLVVGAGFEWLRPSGEGSPESYRKLALGGGLRLGGGLGLGATWEHLFLSRYAGIDSMSAGLGWRPSAYLALGAVGRDLTRPRLPGVPGARLPREWDAEVALRPTGTSRLELAGGLRLLDGAGDPRLGPHGRLQVGLVPGLSLLADFDVPRTRVVTTTLEGARRTRTDWRAGLGLIVSLDRTSLTAAGVGGYRRYDGSGDGTSGPGASLVLKQFFNRQPALLSFPYVARVKVNGLEGDRSFLQAVFGLRRLADDPAVGAVVLQIEGLDVGYGRIEELRAEILSVSRRKPVFAWLSQPDTRQYYLASAATKVAFHPAGSLFLGGLSQTVTFFKNALDKLGVAVELVRIAEYKGAMEPFILPQQSPPVRENRDALIEDLHRRLVAGVVAGRAGRGLGPDRVQRLIDKALFTPAEAKDAGLVDEIVDDRNLEKWVQGSLGRRWSLRNADFGRRESGRWRPSRVALILIDGAIADGKPQGIPAVQGTVAWADPIIDALDSVRRDPSVRAVVLRVNSPGGSAFASDRIARQIVRVREAGKPVIVSMGDTAASGGYYVAAPGDTILASPSVVTGSIGIYAYKLDVGDLMGRLSINAETTSRGARADMFSLYRPWNQEEKSALQSRLDYFYKQFLRVVADGRKAQGITLDRAHELGKGRVYTGAQALGHRLVDRLGTVADAVDEAARRGKVPVGAGGLPEMVVLPNAPTDPLETLLALRRLVEVGADAEGTGTGRGDGVAAAVVDLPGFIARHGRAAARLLLPLYAGKATGIEARLPYEITFE